jgi:hypothetical protein
MSVSLAGKYRSLAEVRADSHSAAYLNNLKGFVYSSDICLGSGSFGKVLLGWTKVVIIVYSLALITLYGP